MNRRETAPEIAERTGRPISTVTKTWMRYPAWPAPVGKRGRHHEYDSADIDRFLRQHTTQPDPGTMLEPGRLYTGAELEACGIGITARSIRSRLTRGTWPAPDVPGGPTQPHRWYGRTITERARLGGRRTTGTGDGE